MAVAKRKKKAAASSYKLNKCKACRGYRFLIGYGYDVGKYHVERCDECSVKSLDDSDATVLLVRESPTMQKALRRVELALRKGKLI